MLLLGLLVLLITAGQPVSASSVGSVPAATTIWLVVPNGASSATAILRVTLPISSLGSSETSSSTLTDNTPGSPTPRVAFSFHGQSDVGAIRVLYFVADVSQIPQMPFSQQRTATLQIGHGSSPIVNYTISNRSPSQSDDLKLFIPPNWSVRSGSLPMTISTHDTPATHLGIDGAFVENATRSPLSGDAVVVCANETGPCEEEVSVPANSTRTVYLRYVGSIQPGIYSGMISVSALEYSGKDANLTLYISSTGRMLTGIAIVVIGGFLAWWVKSYASNRVTRDEALLPISIYQERLATLDSVLKRAEARVGIRLPNLSGAVTQWIQRLDPASLEVQYGLPTRTPSPFAKVPTLSAQYTTFLSNADSAVTLLTIFIQEGIERVIDLGESGRIPSPQVSKTLVSIDDCYNPNLQSPAALQAIQNLISGAKTRALTAKAEKEAEAPSRISSVRLLLEIQTLNKIAWFILLGAASVGTVLAVVLKPGFGNMTDYLLSFATSFGIPVVGGAAIPSRATPASVTTATRAVSGSRGSAGA